jgi:hypothetical protein
MASAQSPKLHQRCHEFFTNCQTIMNLFLRKHLLKLKPVFELKFKKIFLKTTFLNKLLFKLFSGNIKTNRLKN